MSAAGSGEEKRRIIVVEDNALVAKFFRMALERAGGFSCMVTEDVPLILEEVKAGRVDLVLLDLSLTNAEWQGKLVDGVELCRILKEKSPKHLPRAAGHSARDGGGQGEISGSIRSGWIFGEAGVRFRGVGGEGAGVDGVRVWVKGIRKTD